MRFPAAGEGPRPVLSSGLNLGRAGWLALLCLFSLGPGCGGDAETAPAPVVLAGDIPVARTPPGGYGEVFPAPVLAACTEPILEGAPDLRGLWRVVAVERGGRPQPATDPVFRHFERIEQCGNRVVVTGGQIIHDMRCDGTVENGVNDVAAADLTSPIQVVCTFEAGVHVLRPVGLAGLEITRQLAGEEMVWRYFGFTARLRRDPASLTDPAGLS